MTENPSDANMRNQYIAAPIAELNVEDYNDCLEMKQDYRRYEVRTFNLAMQHEFPNPNKMFRIGKVKVPIPTVEQAWKQMQAIHVFETHPELLGRRWLPQSHHYNQNMNHPLRTDAILYQPEFVTIAASQDTGERPIESELKPVSAKQPIITNTLPTTISKHSAYKPEKGGRHNDSATKAEVRTTRSLRALRSAKESMNTQNGHDLCALFLCCDTVGGRVNIEDIVEVIRLKFIGLGEFTK
ncbi:hypothetical protein CC78DRAFT_538830 [Lojkania enalia]|uniref:Uncharacterized protein n=1 Tax=Lojkania enalia TaxID=147567 RepID=A0A9P4TR50_9PLEO|nr:hypothetical protein CC78DRAFT_538830 [Didymosphaeria enalia]